jgi:hypothetical protein
MRKTFGLLIAMLAAVMLVSVTGYVWATDTPATAGDDRITTYYRTGTPPSGNPTLQGLKVIIVYSSYMGSESGMRDSLLSSGIADEVGSFEARWGTPTLEDLVYYDCAIVWSYWYRFSDPIALGDVLADYVETGAGVVACEFCFGAGSGWELMGRFMSNYSPFTVGYVGWERHYLDWYDPTHPIMANVDSCSDALNYEVFHRGDVEDVAHYENDWPLVAVNADNPNVVGINGCFGDWNRQWTGDMMRILLNSVVYASRELTMQCKNLTPIFCQGTPFCFKHVIRNNTGAPVSGTLTFSGYSGYGCDPGNVLVSIPQSQTYQPGETERYYLFRVPRAMPAGQYSASVSGDLGGIDLFCCMNADIIACSPWKMGSSTEWALEEVGRPDALATATSLYQNYPNPFNVNTNISYYLAEAGHVNLNVYDISGRLVTTLLDGYQSAGEHLVSWDASAVPSGVYFYKLTAGNYTSVMKASLLK